MSSCCRRWHRRAAFVLLPLVVEAAASETQGRRPRPVHKRDAAGLGGGSAESSGHGRPMQEQAGRQELEVLAEAPASWAEFYSTYVRHNKPVVIKGAATSMKAFADWTDEYLVRRWGSKPIDVELHKSEERDGPRRSMPLKKFVRDIYKEENIDRLYAVIGFDSDKDWLQDFHMPAFANCKEIHPQSMTLWFSAGGTRSVLHQDDGENFLMLLDGRKEVFLVHQDSAPDLYAPAAKMPGTSAVHHDFVDLETFPRFGNLSWIGGTLEKGDLLYLPVGYWHQVNSFGRNLGVNFWWGHESDFHWWDGSIDMIHLGKPGAVPFNKMKSKMPKEAKCTPFPEGHDMSAPTLTDEGVWRGYLQAQSKRLRQNKKPASPRKLLSKLLERRQREEL